MGCDIHIWCEGFNGEEWRALDLVPNDTFTHPDGTVDYLWKGIPTVRNYATFYFLAGVRERDQDYDPVFAKRGWPSPSCPSHTFNCTDYDDWYHSPTYFTLHEALDAPWEGKPELEKSGFLQWILDLSKDSICTFGSNAPLTPDQIRIIIAFSA